MEVGPVPVVSEPDMAPTVVGRAYPPIEPEEAAGSRALLGEPPAVVRSQAVPTPIPGVATIDDNAFDARPTDARPTDIRPTQPRGVLLIARKSPVLGVETMGPRQIAVGKESSYELTISNSGDVGADDVVVSVDLPEWADVLGAEASTGATRASGGDDEKPAFEWRVGHVEAGGKERLVLRIVPRESRPFDLAVRVDYESVGSQAMIEVQEPKVAVTIEGPSEVLYGQKETYRLRLVNSGNGDAENVTITLMPVGSNVNQPVSHSVGTLAAGAEKTIEVELTARQIGDLIIKVDVRGDGGIHAELAEKVLVRRAALQVDVEGPKVQYVGAVASYRIRVRNPGTATANNVLLSANIPAGAKYVSGIDGSQLTSNGTKVSWKLPSLAAGEERLFAIQCSLGLPGPSRLEVTSQADGDLVASSGATTRVEAIADLTLDVKDPPGPVAVGQETSYELRVRNRGTKDASEIEVIVYFGAGVEPISAEGAKYRIGPGQVVFNAIPSLAADDSIVLTVRAKAERAGNHTFRAEVHCKPLGTRLVSEETTHFYLDDAETIQASEGLPRVSETTPSTDSTRTADRRATVSDKPSEPAATPTGRRPAFLPSESLSTPATHR